MNPNDPSNFERQQELRRQQEALQLRQEEQRLELARRTTTSNWIVNSIYFFVGLLEILLGLRFLLRVLGANTKNTFAQVIYNLSAPFVAPFSTLFVSPVTGGGANIFDVNVLIAIVVYALLGWLAVWLVRLLQGRA
jgi:uncharacterized protein YggT (Ycf19 family)